MTSEFVHTLQLPAHRSPDRNGTLVAVDLVAQLPFPVQRVFWVGDLRRGDRRAGHANALVHEAIACVQGALRVHVRHGGLDRSVDLEVPGALLVVPPGTWVDIEVLRDDSAYLAMASHDYDSAREYYIRDFDTFRERHG